MKSRRGKDWKPRLTRLAQRDYSNINEWTEENFGVRQADAYAALIDNALDRLAANPFAPPSRDRDTDIGKGYRTIRIAKRGRHILVYRLEAERVVILRILHESMELMRHLSAEEEDW